MWGSFHKPFNFQDPNDINNQESIISYVQSLRACCFFFCSTLGLSKGTPYKPSEYPWPTNLGILGASVGDRVADGQCLWCLRCAASRGQSSLGRFQAEATRRKLGIFFHRNKRVGGFGGGGGLTFFLGGTGVFER